MFNNSLEKETLFLQAMRIRNKSILTLFISLLFYSLDAQIPFDQKATNVGNIGLSISNVGTIGRPQVINNTQGLPSMEYPIGSGINHLFEGGLWIGALVNGQVRVSTVADDAPSGYRAGLKGFEFTATGPVLERSSLSSSEFFSGSAVSHQDYIVRINDNNIVIPGTFIQINQHQNPLNADVVMRSYAWNFTFADYFVIVDYTITNKSNDTWDSVYLGQWNDLVVRNLNITQDGGSAFFNKGAGFFLDSLQALAVYQKFGDDIDYTGNYAAVRILGAEWRDKFFHPFNPAPFAAEGLTSPKVLANFWLFGSSASNDFVPPADDAAKYERLSKIMNFSSPSVQTQLSTGSNLIQLISTGPFKAVAPNESVNFTVAYLAAKQLSGPIGGQAIDNEETRTELYRNLGWAFRTYLGEDVNVNGILDSAEDINGDGLAERYVLPEPPATPKYRVFPGDNEVTIYWDAASIESIDPISKKKDFEGYRLYRTNPQDDKSATLLSKANLIAQWDSAGNNIGFNNGFDKISLTEPKFFEGDSVAYKFSYTIKGLLNGWQYLFVLTAFDQGDEELGLEPLESSFTQNAFRIYSGSTPKAITNNREGKVGVYPNPYKGEAAWDGTTARTKKIYFYNLPAQCVIKVFTTSGDLVVSIDHAAETYNGSDIRWFDNFSNPNQSHFAGGEHAWDLLSTSKASVSQGTYIFTVTDKITGKIDQGTFVILK